ncbi:MAG: hypothetical protein COY58_01535 [Gammaproteobacteria bacterium CG_4_10_14_0_8_um_filter_38_16]|nr:MAG: hypothetical protein COY58_01535 [Gammaproteobacteria bacterium CG_4_10_14_0_8_um_filter_38_16]PJA03538.1 MAG: hypothetical protein COX72_04780 [Gammaproteobacteria bacterium CG_4_10_14_0_2_um_filter_38_22]PJB11160.1 MAG: hypothetical protein CO120_01175 [Gammaproteobacteria bacterium CG_4_9_14_3_um_filter_38_9]
MKNKIAQSLFEKYACSHIINTLLPFITDQRKARIESVIQYRLDSITLALENPADINNALACVRTCEALGVSTIHIISPEHDARYIHTITQSAFYWVEIIFHPHLQHFLQAMKNENRIIAGAVLNANTPLSALSIEKPLCLLIGNEHRGLSDEAKAQCDYIFSIPMCGMIDSFNLSVAAAISLFDVTQRKRLQLKNKTDLNEKTATHLRAKYYLNSVSARAASELLKKLK